MVLFFGNLIYWHMKVTIIKSLWRMVGSMLKFVACNISDIFLYPSSGIHCNIEFKNTLGITIDSKQTYIQVVYITHV